MIERLFSTIWMKPSPVASKPFSVSEDRFSPEMSENILQKKSN